MSAICERREGDRSSPSSLSRHRRDPLACEGTDDIVSEPVLVVEVISPSTEREDRGRKKFDYFARPSIRQYASI